MSRFARNVTLVCCNILLNLLTHLVSAEEAKWQRHIVDNSSRGADGVRLADANGDGLLDIATGWEEGGVIRVYLNPGPTLAKQAWPAVTVGRVKSPEDAVLVDLDGDGRMDVVSCCEGANRTVFVHWAPSDPKRYLDEKAWTTEPLPATLKQRMWMFAVPMQVDGRRGIDLVVGSKGPQAAIGWLRSPDDPRRLADWKYHEWTSAGWIMSLQAHDLDGDGDLDILASDRKGDASSVLWIENTLDPQREVDRGAGSANWPVHRIGGLRREVMFLSYQATDAVQSIVAAVRPSSLLWLSSNRKQAREPWSSVELSLPSGCGTAKAAAIADVDLDGRVDIVFTCENATKGLSGARWISAVSELTKPSADTEAPIFTNNSAHEISGPEGVKFDRIEMLDLDDDGDLDLLTCEERDNLGVIWYENPAR
ncbi:MAG: VCBS repeat-containing protein [Pirellulaceae bacterium]